MTEPLSIDTVLSEFPEDTEAWVLKDESSEQYLSSPHPKYPGRHPLQFFLSRRDAELVLMEVLDANPRLRDRNIFPERVRLLQAIRYGAWGGQVGRSAARGC
jgi:hypothetical protein